jgi:hypothetical protein
VKLRINSVTLRRRIEKGALPVTPILGYIQQQLMTKDILSMSNDSFRPLARRKKMKAHCWQNPRCTTCLFASLVIAALLMVLFACIAEAGGAGPKVVILELHGMKKGTLDENLEGLPNFQEMLKGSNNDQPHVYLPRVFTTLPAASQPAVTSMYTGLYPQRTGVVSTIWFDRTTFEIRTLISYSQNRMNSILTANGVKTLFDYVGEADKHSIFLGQCFGPQCFSQWKMVPKQPLRGQQNPRRLSDWSHIVLSEESRGYLQISLTGPRCNGSATVGYRFVFPLSRG